MAVHPRRVTLSTVGLLPALERLATEPIMPNLAISLHATTDESRSALVPINKRYDLARCSRPAGDFRSTAGPASRSSTSCSTASTTRPRTRAASSGCSTGCARKVNLLPLNEAPGIPFTRPDEDRVNAFARILADRDVVVSVRKSRGRDIRAACGQLIVEGGRPSPAQDLAARIPPASSSG